MGILKRADSRPKLYRVGISVLSLKTDLGQAICSLGLWFLICTLEITEIPFGVTVRVKRANASKGLRTVLATWEHRKYVINANCYYKRHQRMLRNSETRKGLLHLGGCSFWRERTSACLLTVRAASTILSNSTESHSSDIQGNTLEAPAHWNELTHLHRYSLCFYHM